MTMNAAGEQDFARGEPGPAPGPTRPPLPYRWKNDGSGFAEDPGIFGGRGVVGEQFDWEMYLEHYSIEELTEFFDQMDMDMPQGLKDHIAQVEAQEHVPLWLHNMPDLQQAWIDAWIETGNKTLAREAVREHENYEQHFPGNLREDGTVHITEGEYHSLIEGYENVLVSHGLNPDIFHSLFANLVAGDIDIGEFTGRVEAVRTQIIDQAASVAERYSEYYGFEMTPEAIFASFLDPTVADAILNRRISVSQVGSSAWEKGFTVDQNYVEGILNEGLTVGQAQDFFTDAENMLPTLQVLAARHADPDDTFDLNEFTQAQVMDDPLQRQRVRRLMAQERTSFGADRGLTISRDQGGGLAGLVDR